MLGYGGAAGGGKSWLLLGLAITQHRRSLLLRREAEQVRGLVDDARNILGTVGQANTTTGLWRLPDGRQIKFAGCKDPGDEHKHKGQAKDLLGIDEADQFLEATVKFLMGWLRTEVVGQRCRVVLCFNPPSTAEGLWLLDYFGPWINRRHPKYPTPPGVLRWYATLPDGKEVERENGDPFRVYNERRKVEEEIRPMSRTFIPAHVQDNPAYMRTGYLSTLLAMPEPLRSQLAYGDMEAGLVDDAWQVIPTEWVQAAMERWKPKPPPGSQLDAIGVDVARGGKAKTVLAPRWGTWFDQLRKHPGKSTPDGAAVLGQVEMELATNPNALVCIDVIGVGSSPYDWMRAQGVKRLMAVDFRQGTEARDASGQFGFRNVRAFAWWSMREVLDPASGMNVALPPDPELLADLTAPKWKRVLQGIQLEEKEEIEKRIGRSPDCGDAVVNAVLLPPPGSDGSGDGGLIRV